LLWRQSCLDGKKLTRPTRSITNRFDVPSSENDEHDCYSFLPVLIGCKSDGERNTITGTGTGFASAP